MNSIFSPGFLIGASVAVAALGAAGVAEARPEVYRPGVVQSGPAGVERAPVHLHPRPVYLQPAPVYTRPPVFVRPYDVFAHPHRGAYPARFQWQRERAWRRAERLRQQRHDAVRGGGRDDVGRGDHRGHRGHRD